MRATTTIALIAASFGFQAAASPVYNEISCPAGEYPYSLVARPNPTPEEQVCVNQESGLKLTYSNGTQYLGCVRGEIWKDSQDNRFVTVDNELLLCIYRKKGASTGWILDQTAFRVGFENEKEKYKTINMTLVA